MRKRKILLVIVLFVIMGLSGFAQTANDKTKPADTNGLAALEEKIELFKPLLQDLSAKINANNNLDSIRFLASIIGQLSDSLTNQMVPIFQGFYAIHPAQYMPIKNISDLTDNIVSTKNVAKAKKYGLKISTEYDNLMKAK